MNKSLVKIDHKEYGLEKMQAENIEKAFMPKIAEREGLEQIYKQIITQEITLELTGHAKSVRLKLVKVRTGMAEVHKTQKAFFRAAGLYVDAWKNKETLPVTQMEEKLLEIEDYYENIEIQRLDKVESERILKLQKYEVDTEHYDLRNMTAPGFGQLLEASKIAFQERVKAAEKNEQERLAKEKADAEEQERIKKENEILKKEAKKREQLAKIETEKQAKIEAKRKEKEEKERVAYEEKLNKEREAKEKIEAELKQKRDAEERAKREASEKAQAEKEAKEKTEREARLAPDKKKLERLAVTIQEIQMPDVTSKEAKNIIENVVGLLNKTSNFIKEKSITI